jgi:hypothetical protein
MKEIFIQFAPYVTFLFLVALPPELIRNWVTKVYSSGTLQSWSLRVIGYTVFGIYSFIIGEYIVALVQFIALILSAIIIAQSFIYRHAM